MPAVHGRIWWIRKIREVDPERVRGSGKTLGWSQLRKPARIPRSVEEVIPKARERKERADRDIKERWKIKTALTAEELDQLDQKLNARDRAAGALLEKKRKEWRGEGTEEGREMRAREVSLVVDGLLRACQYAYITKLASLGVVLEKMIRLEQELRGERLAEAGNREEELEQAVQERLAGVLDRLEPEVQGKVLRLLEEMEVEKLREGEDEGKPPDELSEG